MVQHIDGTSATEHGSSADPTLIVSQFLSSQIPDRENRIHENIDEQINCMYVINK